jgi:MFS transporter, PPP family, 3-phenylpropionic acid transporter
VKVSRLLERFGSRHILVVAVAMYVVRLFLYSLPPALSWVVWVQLLHGVSFGLFLIAAVTLMHQLAGGERAATAQGLLSASSQGFGAVTGALVGGMLLDQIGALGILRVATLGMVLALGFCMYSVRAQTASRGVPKRGLGHMTGNTYGRNLPLELNPRSAAISHLVPLVRRG